MPTINVPGVGAVTLSQREYSQLPASYQQTQSNPNGGSSGIANIQVPNVGNVSLTEKEYNQLPESYKESRGYYPIIVPGVGAMTLTQQEYSQLPDSYKESAGVYVIENQGQGLTILSQREYNQLPESYKKERTYYAPQQKSQLEADRQRELTTSNVNNARDANQSDIAYAMKSAVSRAKGEMENQNMGLSFSPNNINAGLSNIFTGRESSYVQPQGIALRENWLTEMGTGLGSPQKAKVQDITLGEYTSDIFSAISGAATGNIFSTARTGDTGIPVTSSLNINQGDIISNRQNAPGISPLALIPGIGPNLVALQNFNYLYGQRLESKKLIAQQQNKEYAIQNFEENLNILNWRTDKTQAPPLNYLSSEGYTKAINTNLGFLSDSGVKTFDKYTVSEIPGKEDISNILTTSKEVTQGRPGETITTITNTLTTDKEQEIKITTSREFGYENIGTLLTQAEAYNQVLIDTGASRTQRALFDLERVGAVGTKAGVEGLALVGGIEFLGLAAGAQTLFVGIAGSGKVGAAAIGIGSKIATGGIVAYTGYESYKGGKRAYEITGGDIQSTITGAALPVASTAGFAIGFSKGALSPLQAQTYSDSATLQTQGFNVGFVNPLGRSGKTLVSYDFAGGWKFGTATPNLLPGQSIEASGQLGREMLRNSLSKSVNPQYAKEAFALQEATTKNVYKLESPGRTTLDITQNKFFNKLNPSEQKELLKISKELGSSGEYELLGGKSGSLNIKSVFRSVKENMFGGAFRKGATPALERQFGSLTIKGEGGISRTPGDIDYNLYGKAIPYTETIASRLNVAGGRNAFSAKEGKLLFKGEKIGEGFGLDVPSEIKSPLGFRGRLPKTMQFSTGGLTVGQKLGESYVQKQASSLNIVGVEGGGFRIGPRPGQEKSISDIYNILGRASELSPSQSVSLKAAQTQYGQFAKTYYPGLDLKTGVTLGSTTIKTLPVTSSLVGSVFSSKSLPSNVNSIFSRSSMSVPSRSISSFSSYPSSKSSSSYSTSSLSSISSRSSSSSSSSYSTSSFSSSSSSSSSSSYSSSSSSSSSSSYSSSNYGGMYFPPLRLPEMGGDLQFIKPSRRGKKSGFNISPGFSSIVTGKTISSPLRVSRELGVTPFQVRGIKSKGFKGSSYFRFV